MKMDFITDHRARDIGLLVAVLSLVAGLGAWWFPRSSGEAANTEIPVPSAGSQTEVPRSGSSEIEKKIPVYSGEIGHLLSSFSATLIDHLDEDRVYELHLYADAEKIDDGPGPSPTECGEYLSACSLLWATECEPGVDSIGDHVKDDLIYIIGNCAGVVTLRVVDAAGNEAPGWVWTRGGYSLDGYFVVVGSGFGQGILETTVREVPPEIALQID